MSQKCPVNFKHRSILTPWLRQQHMRNKSKLNCKALLVYGPFIQQKSVLLQCQKKGKTIYGLFVGGDSNTPLVEDWKSPINRTSQSNKGWLENHKSLSSNTQNVFYSVHSFMQKVKMQQKWKQSSFTETEMVKAGIHVDKYSLYTYSMCGIIIRLMQ